MSADRAVSADRAASTDAAAGPVDRVGPAGSVVSVGRWSMSRPLQHCSESPSATGSGRVSPLPGGCRSSTSAGRSAVRRGSTAFAPATSPAPGTPTSRRCSRGRRRHRSTVAGAIPCPTRPTWRPTSPTSGSPARSRSSSSTPPVRSRRPGRGGCSAGPGSPPVRWRCSTAVRPRGRRPACPSRPQPGVVPPPRPAMTTTQQLRGGPGGRPPGPSTWVAATCRRSTPTVRRSPARSVGSSTRGRRSGGAATSSRSTRAPGTSRVPGTSRGTATSVRTAGGCPPGRWPTGSARPVSAPPARTATRTAARTAARTAVRNRVSCGSGVSAAHLVLAAVVAGLSLPALYPGSFSGWVADASRPVETV